MTMTQTEPLMDDYEQFELTARLMELYSAAKDVKQRKHAEWSRNYLLTFNRSSGSNTRPGSGVRDSEIYPILRNRVAWMTDQKIDFDVVPAVDPQAEFAKYEQKIGHHMALILSSNWNTQAWFKQQSLMLWDSAICGAAIVKAVWDSGLDGGIGNVSMQRRAPWKIYPDPEATSDEDLAYIFEVNRMTYDEIQRRFPETSEALLDEIIMTGDSGDMQQRSSVNGSMANRMVVPGNIPGNAGTPWGRPGQGTRSAEQVMTNGVNVYECWIRENSIEERQTTDPLQGETETVVSDCWRVVVFSGNHVLLDTTAEELWQHDRHPNSGLARTQIVNRPGLRLSMDAQVANTAGANPQWLAPPPMSSDVLQLISLWRSVMENISGLSSTQKGQTTGGRQAQQTIQSAQEAGFVSIRASQRNMETCLARTGTLLVHLIAQNYTTPRVVAIVGDKGTETSLLLAARHFYSPSRNFETQKYDMTPLVFALNVSAGSDRPTSRQARIAEADALFAMKSVDQQFLLQAHQISDWEEIIQRMQAQALEMAKAAAAGKGGKGGSPQPTGPGTGHAH